MYGLHTHVLIERDRNVIADARSLFRCRLEHGFGACAELRRIGKAIERNKKPVIAVTRDGVGEMRTEEHPRMNECYAARCNTDARCNNRREM